MAVVRTMERLKDVKTSAGITIKSNVRNTP